MLQRREATSAPAAPPASERGLSLLAYPVAREGYDRLSRLLDVQYLRADLRFGRTRAVLATLLGLMAFVLVSTDKAVNPKTVMGQSKALCEWLAVHRMSGPMRCAYRFKLRYAGFSMSRGTWQRTKATSTIPLLDRQSTAVGKPRGIR